MQRKVEKRGGIKQLEILGNVTCENDCRNPEKGTDSNPYSNGGQSYHTMCYKGRIRG